MYKEVARLRKQQQKREGERAGVTGRLNNQKFLSKAPEHVVADVKKQRDESVQRLSVIEEKLQQMLSLAGANA